MEERPLKVLNELRLNDIEIQKKYEKNNKDGRRILYYDIELTNQKELTSCQLCGSKYIERYGKRSKSIKDVPDIYQTPVVLNVRQIQRYMCTQCNTTFSTNIDFADEDYQITTRLRQRIQASCLSYPVSELAEQLNVASTTVEKIIKGVIENCEQSEKFQYTPRILGLFSAKIWNYKLLLCLDMCNNGIIDVVNLSDCADLKQNLEERFDFSVPKAVVITLDGAGISAVIEDINPEIDIVVDRIDVLKQLTKSLTKDFSGEGPFGMGLDRRTMQLAVKNPKNLSETESNELNRLLREKYNDTDCRRLLMVKNEYYRLFDARTLREAEGIFDGIEDLVSKNHKNTYKLTKTISKSLQEAVCKYVEIDNEIDAKTSASAMSLLYRMEKTSARFSFPIVRARVLFSVMAKEAYSVLPGNSYKEFCYNFTASERTRRYYIDAVLGEQFCEYALRDGRKYLYDSKSDTVQQCVRCIDIDQLLSAFEYPVSNDLPSREEEINLYDLI